MRSCQSIQYQGDLQTLAILAKQYPEHALDSIPLAKIIEFYNNIGIQLTIKRMASHSPLKALKLEKESLR